MNFRSSTRRKSSTTGSNNTQYFQIGDHQVRRRPYSEHRISFQNEIYGVEVLGEGGFSVVVPAVNRTTGQHVAIKVCDKQKCDKYLDTEIAIMNRLHHENIVELLSVDQDDQNIFITLEYVGGGTMHKYINSYRVSNQYLERDQLRGFFRQLIAGIEHCHQNGVAHRDLKLANILLTEDQETIKLCDFGLSSVDVDTVKGMRGTRHFMAPEVFMSKRNGSRYSPYACDVWAAGVILFLMAARDYPFHPNIVDSPHWTQISQGYGVELPQELTDLYGMELTDMLNGLWRPDPEDRFTLDEIKAHPFLTMESGDGEEVEVQTMMGADDQGGYASPSSIDADASVSVSAVSISEADLQSVDEGAGNDNEMVTESAQRRSSNGNTNNNNNGDNNGNNNGNNNYAGDNNDNYTYDVPYASIDPGGPADSYVNEEMSTVEEHISLVDEDEDAVQFRGAETTTEGELPVILSFHGKVDDEPHRTRFFTKMEATEIYQEVLKVLTYNKKYSFEVKENEAALELLVTENNSSCGKPGVTSKGPVVADELTGKERRNFAEGDYICDDSTSFTVRLYKHGDDMVVVDFQKMAGCEFGFSDMFFDLMSELEQFKYSPQEAELLSTDSM